MKIFEKNLDELNGKQSEEIALFFCKPTTKIDSLFDNDYSQNDIIQLVNLINKSLQSNSLLNCIAGTFLPKLIESKFWNQHVYKFLGDKFTNYSEFLNVVKSVLDICHKILIIDDHLIYKLDPIIERLDILIKYRLNSSSLYEEYCQGLQKFMKKSTPKKNETDFTKLSIIPQIRDILNPKTPRLNQNIIKGSYENVHAYLDTHFRLLREDFLQPLRLGVGKFREIIKDANLQRNERLNENVRYKLSRIESLNVFFNVRMINNLCTDQGVVYTMQLDWTSRKRTNWETSKKLIFGSLVCLSSDYYSKECIIGTICNRDSDALINQGLIQIKFNYDTKDMMNQFCFPSPNKSYVMLETTAFFESYRHVLHALASFGQSPESEFPFKDNLINVQNFKIDRPEYLKNAFIDFRPLVDKKKTQKMDLKTGFSKYEFSDQSSYASNCSISNPDGWPNAEQMGLDQSQYEAIKLALESKLALIQGPPGTGKTYIGVKLVELLVHNKNLWWQRPGDRKRPILMVCYTNHALDQFLEYCVNVCKLDKGVVRVGSRCKNENLNSFLLSKLKRNFGYDREILQAIKLENNKLLNIQKKLEQLSNLLNGINEKSGIVSFNLLKKYINEEHLKQLENFNHDFENRTCDDYTLLEWLGAFDIDTDSARVSDLARDLEKLNVVDMESAENKKQDVYDFDNQYLNNERMLEDDFLIGCLHQDVKKRSHLFIDYDEISDMVYYFNELNNTTKNPENCQYLIKRRKKFKMKKSDVNSVREHFETLHKFNIGRNNYNLDESYNIWRLNVNERFSSYLTWVEKLKQDKQVELEDLVMEFNQSSTILQEIRMQKDKAIMENALIIAMTTTGSSRYHKILKDIGPRIVIVEEAAEVFEAHIVSSLSKHCEHLILIGDHAQLRPNPAVYNLAIDYHLDVSLFERLLNNDTKKVMLKTQHRMRPEISILMKHFYEKKIENHSSVLEFESIRGIEKNIFFINHSKLEHRLNDSLSKFNSHEAKYLTKLCVYLMKQGYLQSQITVLTMYLGQASELRNLLRALNLIEIRVSTVDNFQGEENDIILLSLVRSNSYGKIGFLNIHNRVCVSLSRARKGFYCIGNLDFISQYSSKWANIIQNLKELNLVSNGLKLTCNSHPEHDIIAVEPEDFDTRPDGGCNLKCNFKLKCGHLCTKFCHGNTDSNHLLYQCTMACEKINPICGHECTFMCCQTEKCSSCRVKVQKTVVECGHTIDLYCNTEPVKAFCYIPCEFTLKCGHKCGKVCARHSGSDDHDLVCKTLIQIESKCKHKTKIWVPCSEKSWLLETKCEKKCGEILDCGHVCSFACGQCIAGRVHRKCDELIDREMPCGHKSTIECSKKFEPCKKSCFYKCSHKFIDSSCVQPTYKCTHKCNNVCEHYKCEKKCFEICDRPPCNEQCKRKLKCGHQCIGVCGEPCPRLCRFCDRTKVMKIFFGTERNENAKFVFLFDCKHLFESNGLDNWVKMSKSPIPSCPKCKTPIRSVLRYSNLIKQQKNQIEEFKEIEYGNFEENFIEQENLKEKIEQHFLKNEKLEIKQEFDLKFIKIFYSNLNEKQLTRNELVAYKQTFLIFIELLELRNFNFEHMIDEASHLEYEIKKFENFIYDSNSDQISLCSSEGNFYEILNELKRVKLIFEIYSLKQKIESKSLSDFKKLDIQNSIIYLKNQLADSNNRVDDDQQIMIKDKLDKLNILIESESIVKHVFKFPI